MPADTFGCNGWIRTSPAMDCLLGRIAISGGQLDDLRSLIKNVEAYAAAAAALESTSAWRSLWAVQPRERLRAAIRLTPDYTCLHVANIDLVEGFEDG